jgi:hypothetical protein
MDLTTGTMAKVWSVSWQGDSQTVASPCTMELGKGHQIDLESVPDANLLQRVAPPWLTSLSSQGPPFYTRAPAALNYSVGAENET